MTESVFRMSIDNFCRVFFNGEIYQSTADFNKLAHDRFEDFLKGLDLIERNVNKIRSNIEHKQKVAKPKVAKPKVAKPKVAKPKVAKPKVAKPKVAKPKVAKPKRKKKNE